MRHWLLTLVLPIVVASTASADPVSRDQVMRAQGDLERRVDLAVATYAAHIGMMQYTQYCLTEMNRVTSGHTIDGSIPFGVNYNEITDSDMLAHVVQVRESYERSFQILCLANAKNSLREAERK
jgi:hypothetical protein